MTLSLFNSLDQDPALHRQLVMREQSEAFRKGVQCDVANPGRLKDILSKRILNLGLS